jgi:hypothetical protein
MAGDANALLSGTAMSVLLGGGSILTGFLYPGLDIGSRLILAFTGMSFVIAGLQFSKA